MNKPRSQKEKLDDTKAFINRYERRCVNFSVQLHPQGDFLDSAGWKLNTANKNRQIKLINISLGKNTKK